MNYNQAGLLVMLRYEEHVLMTKCASHLLLIPHYQQNPIRHDETKTKYTSLFNSKPNTETYVSPWL